MQKKNHENNFYTHVTFLTLCRRIKTKEWKTQRKKNFKRINNKKL